MNKTANTFTIRRSNERGQADHGWLKSQHTFSFANYYDPAHMGFRSLRVINEDQVHPGQGFPAHPHRDMEIFSYVLSGALAHKDSLGNERELQPGEIQLMSAGQGVTHSEYNPSRSTPVHFFQIWIQPRQHGLKPSYTEWRPTPESLSQSKLLVISPDGRENSATIQQDAFVYRLKLETGQTLTHDLAENRGLWLQIANGKVKFSDETLHAGDAASTETAGTFSITALEPTEALLFDLH